MFKAVKGDRISVQNDCRLVGHLGTKTFGKFGTRTTSDSRLL